MFSEAATAAFDDCENADFTTGNFKKLSDSDVFWTYVDGDKRVREDMVSGENLRKYLVMLARASGGSISYLKFYHFVIEANENYRDMDEGEFEDITEIISPKEMFYKIATSGSDVMKLGQIMEASEEIFEELAAMVTPPHTHHQHRDEL